MPRERAERLLFARVGGSLDEISASLDFLHQLVLTQHTGDRLARTRDGDVISKKIRRGTPHELAAFLLRTGVLAGQIRAALAIGSIENNSMRLPLAQMKRAAPQLLAVLSRIPDVQIGSPIVVPGALVAELESAWNQTAVPGPAALPNMDVNMQVGERAEQYSLQLERSAYIGASTGIDWVSRDDPNAGYDLEILNEIPSRCVEVKGTRGTAVGFFLSTNELNSARKLGARYEIHFWADIRLHIRAPDDYSRLREAGYPLVIRDPANTLFNDEWTCEPTEYRVRRAQP